MRRASLWGYGYSRSQFPAIQLRQRPKIPGAVQVHLGALSFCGLIAIGGTTMNLSILRAFEAAPMEAAILGRLLAGYGELEFEFCNCVAAVLDDRQSAIRTLFRVRSEDSRILIGDGIMRSKYIAADLADGYGEMLGALKYCKSVRNQYAHCHWMHEPAKGLFFTKVADAAKAATGELKHTFFHVSAPLLNEQEQYFCYCEAWLLYLQSEYQQRAGKSAIPLFEAPKIMPQPPRQSPPGTYSPLFDNQTQSTPPEEPNSEAT